MSEDSEVPLVARALTSVFKARVTMMLLALKMEDMNFEGVEGGVETRELTVSGQGFEAVDVVNGGVEAIRDAGL
jgi:hypothetical protein